MQIVVRRGESFVFATYADDVQDVAARSAGLGPCDVFTVPDNTLWTTDAEGRLLDPRQVEPQPR
jgi:hypothetical protein